MKNIFIFSPKKPFPIFQENGTLTFREMELFSPKKKIQEGPFRSCKIKKSPL